MNPPRRDETTAFRLLTGIFLRRLIDNDLVSPHADRHESVAVIYGLIVTLGLFAAFLLSTGYLAAFVQLPGPAALSALSDRFLFIAASISMSALAALLVWDGLAVESRDAAILGPLPIAPRTIARAKLAAALTFGAAVTIALNAISSVLYPLFLTLNIRGTTGRTVIGLIAAHAAMVTMAGLFGFVGVLALRGSAHLLLGNAVFRRISSPLQSVLVVGMATALMLAPTVRATEVRRWIQDGVPFESPAQPVLWFLGFNETVAGHRVNETPVVPPPRFSLAEIPRDGDEPARAIYRAMTPRFATLARSAWVSLLAVITGALTTFLWLNRRLPERAVAAIAPSPIRRALRRLAERATQHDPEMQAGFFLTLHTLSRSAPHRAIIAVAAAFGLTHALIALTQGAPAAGIASTPLGLFGIAVMVLLTLSGGFAYAVTVPAEPAASWTIRTAWRGDERPYLAGVKRCAVLLVIGLLFAALPLHIALLGTLGALGHSLLAALLTVVVFDAQFLYCRTLPFACMHTPIENPKFVWPAIFAGLLIVTYAFAALERWALQSAPRTLLVGAALASVVFAVRGIDHARRERRQPINFDGRPSPPTQRLGLFEHIVTQD